MKKSAILFGFLSIASMPVIAQSSVTLYGIIDTGFVYSNNVGGDKLYATSAGNLQGDRWGLRGREDLGGGLAALFVLENGFNVNTGRLGQGGAEFGRQAYVGLSSRLGTVTFGRQYDSVVDYVGQFEVGDQWASAYAAHPGDLDNFNNSFRVNNAIKYSSTSYAGFTFGGLYSLGGIAGQFNKNQIWSAGLGYTNGPLSFSAAYLNVKDPNFSAFGNNPSASANGSNMTGSQVFAGFATARTEQVIGAGVAYTFGAATIGGTYSNTQFKGLGQNNVAGLAASTPNSGDGKFHNFEASYKYQISPALVLGLAYDYTKAYSIADEKIHQGVIGGDYFMSKRTDLYADVVYQHVSGKNSSGATATAQIPLLSASSTSNQFAAVVGIRHKF